RRLVLRTAHELRQRHPVAREHALDEIGRRRGQTPASGPVPTSAAAAYGVGAGVGAHAASEGAVASTRHAIASAAGRRLSIDTSRAPSAARLVTGKSVTPHG